MRNATLAAAATAARDAKATAARDPLPGMPRQPHPGCTASEGPQRTTQLAVLRLGTYHLTAEHYCKANTS